MTEKQILNVDDKSNGAQTPPADHTDRLRSDFMSTPLSQAKEAFGRNPDTPKALPTQASHLPQSDSDRDVQTALADLKVGRNSGTGGLNQFMNDIDANNKSLHLPRTSSDPDIVKAAADMYTGLQTGSLKNFIDDLDHLRKTDSSSTFALDIQLINAGMGIRYNWGGLAYSHDVKIVRDEDYGKPVFGSKVPFWAAKSPDSAALLSMLQKDADDGHSHPVAVNTENGPRPYIELMAENNVPGKVWLGNDRNRAVLVGENGQEYASVEQHRFSTQNLAEEGCKMMVPSSSDLIPERDENGLLTKVLAVHDKFENLGGNHYRGDTDKPVVGAEFTRDAQGDVVAASLPGAGANGSDVHYKRIGPREWETPEGKTKGDLYVTDTGTVVFHFDDNPYLNSRVFEPLSYFGTRPGQYISKDNPKRNGQKNDLDDREMDFRSQLLDSDPGYRCTTQRTDNQGNPLPLRPVRMQFDMVSPDNYNFKTLGRGAAGFLNPPGLAEMEPGQLKPKTSNQDSDEDYSYERLLWRDGNTTSNPDNSKTYNYHGEIGIHERTMPGSKSDTFTASETISPDGKITSRHIDYDVQQVPHDSGLSGRVERLLGKTEPRTIWDLASGYDQHQGPVDPIKSVDVKYDPVAQQYVGTATYVDGQTESLRFGDDGSLIDPDNKHEVFH